MDDRTRPLRFTVLGLALSHPYAFARHLEAGGHSIVAVWDPDTAKAAEYAAAHGCRVLSNPGEAAGACDAVIVTNVIANHAEAAKPYLEAGIPAFVDKFLSTDVREAEEMVALAQRAGGVLMSASCIRFMPPWRALEERVKSGAVGRPLTAEAVCFHDISGFREGPSAWQDDPALSGGSLMNMGIHCTDPLIAALGPDIAAVTASASKRVHEWSRSEDQAVILIRWKNGVIGTARIVCGSTVGGYGLSVVTEAAELTARPGDGADYYGPMLDAFVEGARTGMWPLPPEELLANVRALSAARRAVTTNGWVPLA